MVFFLLALMASLQHLPTELVLAIVSFVSPIEVRKLSLVCKRFCNLAQPLLYRNISHDFPDLIKNSSHRLLMLTRTIVSRPDLARQIRCIGLNFAKHGYEQNHPGSFRQTTGECDVLSPEPLSHQRQEEHDVRASPFIGRLRNKTDGKPNVAETIPLLLSHLSSLEVLTIDMAWFGTFTGVSTLPLLDGNVGHSTLTSLRSLQLTYSDCQRAERASIRLVDIVPILMLPQLDELRLDHCCGHSNDCSGITTAHIPPGSLAVSRMRLCYSHVDAASMIALIEGCKSLTAFEYRLPLDTSSQFRPGELELALYAHQNCLQEYRVSFYDSEWGNDMGRIWAGATSGPFGVFQKLEILEVDQSFIDVLPELPRSLRALILQNCHTSVYLTMSQLACRAKAGDLPLLETIYLSTDVLAPGRMLDLPSRGATDILLRESCNNLTRLFHGTGVNIQFEDGLLAKSAHDYSFAFDFGPSGNFWPLIYLS